MIEIQLNGEPRTLDGEQPVSELLQALGIKTSRVAVEINLEVIPKAEYERRMIRASDHVEVINFVGGG